MFTIWRLLLLLLSCLVMCRPILSRNEIEDLCISSSPPPSSYLVISSGQKEFVVDKNIVQSRFSRKKTWWAGRFFFNPNPRIAKLYFFLDRHQVAANQVAIAAIQSKNSPRPPSNLLAQRLLTLLLLLLLPKYIRNSWNFSKNHKTFPPQSLFKLSKQEKGEEKKENATTFFCRSHRRMFSCVVFLLLISLYSLLQHFLHPDIGKK